MTRVGPSERGKRASFKFNIRAFHDAVLELGSLPLPVVTARVDRFIAEGAKALTRIWSEQVFGVSGQVAFAPIEIPGGLGRYFPDPCDNIRCLNDLLSLSHVGRQTVLPRS